MAARSTSIRGRLTLATILLATLPLALLVMMLSWRMLVAQRAEALNLHQQVASRATQEIFSEIRRVEDRFAVASSLCDITSGDEKHMHRALSLLLASKNEKHQSFIDEISLLTPEGRERFRLSRNEWYTQEDHRDRASEPLVTRAICDGSITYSPLFTKSLTNEPIIEMAFPVFNPRNGRIAAVITAHVRLQSAWDSVVSSRVGTRGHVFIVDSGHRIVAHANTSYVLQAKRFSFTSNEGLLMGPEKVPVFYAAIPFKLGEQQFFVVTTQPITESFAITWKALATILILLAVFLGIGAAAGLLSVRRIIRPLETLATATRDIGTGDLTARVPLFNLEELDRLAESFNNMAETLQADRERRLNTERQLQESNEQLEQRVLERTAELATINAHLRQEIVERSIAENDLRRYRNIVSASRDHLSFVDWKYVYRAVNDAYLDYHGIRREEIVGRQVADILGWKIFNDSIKNMLDRALGGEPVQYEQWFDFRARGRRFMEVRYLPYREGDGPVLGVVVNARDNTERFSLEQSLRQAEKMKAVGTLAAGIAHDFNNILNAIMGGVFVAKHEARGQEKIVGHMEDIEKACRRAAELVRQILTFSRPTAAAKTIVALEPLVKETILLQSRTMPGTIKVDSSMSSCGPVLANPTQMLQVITNLVTNACHAMQDTGGTLTIRLDEVEELPENGDKAFPDGQPTCFVRLLVRDTGHGMDQETLRHIFDPFFTTKEFGQGSGLGLAICLNIVKETGGTIKVVSEPGQGSTFEVILPRVAVTLPSPDDASEETCLAAG